MVLVNLTLNPGKINLEFETGDLSSTLDSFRDRLFNEHNYQIQHCIHKGNLLSRHYDKTLEELGFEEGMKLHITRDILFETEKYTKPEPRVEAGGSGPGDAGSGAGSTPVNPEMVQTMVAMLEGLGFTEERIAQAQSQYGDNIQLVTSALLNTPQDAEITEPIPQTFEFQEQLENFISMGYEDNQEIRDILRATGGDIIASMDILHS